jgi:hypothetical protein
LTALIAASYFEKLKVLIFERIYLTVRFKILMQYYLTRPLGGVLKKLIFPQPIKTIKMLASRGIIGTQGA